MKKLLLALGVATAFTGSAFADVSQPTGPSEGHSVGTAGSTIGGSDQAVGKPQTDSHTISFTGIVSARSCKIEKSGEAIDLGVVDAVDIKKGKAPEKDISIKLTSCGLSYSDKVSVLLEPADNTDGNGSLENRLEEDGATDAVLSVKNKDSKLINLDGSEEDRTLEYKVLNAESGDYEFKIKVQYAVGSLNDKVLAGRFISALPFTVVYK